MGIITYSIRPAYMDLSELFKTPPPSPAEQLAADARKLASEGKDLSSVSYAIDSAERERQRGIEKSLEATLELQKLSDSGKNRISKEFLLTFQAGNGEIKTIRGVEWPDDREDKTKNDYTTRVLLDTTKNLGTLSRSSYSMSAFKESLDKLNILYRLAYIN